MEDDDDDDDNLPQLKESEPPFVPNYLANPAFPFIYTPVAEDSAPLQNGGPSTPPASPPADGEPPLLPSGEPPLLGAFPRDHTSLALVQNGDVSAPAAILRTPESTKPGPVCQPPVSQSRSLFSSVSSKPPVSLEPQNGTHTGPTPAFQPFFFTGAFPFNMQGNPLSANSLHKEVDNIQRSRVFTSCSCVCVCVWRGGVICLFILSVITDLQKSCRNSLYSDSQIVTFCPFTLNYLSVYFLRTRIVSYIIIYSTIINLGNVILI